MGCDIHCFIEYRKKGAANWRDFGGRINPGRNYLLFGALAGVRVDGIAHVLPRGLAPDMASAAFRHCSIFISDTVYSSCGWESHGADTYYSRAYAEKCVANGYCQWLPCSEKDVPPSYVTHSDWHNHSWLSPDEFEMALAVYLKESGFVVGAKALPAPAEVLSCQDLALVNGKSQEEAKWALEGITEYWAVLQAMRCFEAQGCEARLVFWFDN